MVTLWRKSFVDIYTSGRIIGCQSRPRLLWMKIAATWKLPYFMLLKFQKFNYSAFQHTEITDYSHRMSVQAYDVILQWSSRQLQTTRSWILGKLRFKELLIQAWLSAVALWTASRALEALRSVHTVLRSFNKIALAGSSVSNRAVQKEGSSSVKSDPLEDSSIIPGSLQCPSRAARSQ